MSADVWRAVSAEITRRIEILRDQMERAPTDSVIQIQARIRAYRDVLAMPESLRKTPETRIGDDDPAFPS
jgi:hypothetical protein